MHIDSSALLPVLVSLLLVMTRIGSAIALVPIPGMKTNPEVPKAILVLATTVALCRYWMIPVSNELTGAGMLGAIFAEASMGVVVGVAVSLLLEAAQVAGQMISLQAGFSYASTIDPSSEVDSGIVLILCQLLTAFIFFALGLDRAILASFGHSFERIPPGSYHLDRSTADLIVQLGSAMFQTAFRLAMPLTAILLVADIAMALAGRFLQKLQLSSVMFPVKTLGALAMFAIASATSARLISQWLTEGWRIISRISGI